MPEKYTSLEEIREWLVNGTDNPETFVDLRWQVLEEKREDGKLTALRVTHPKVPLDLTVTDLERSDSKLKIVRLAADTGVDTVDLEPGDKLKLYRTLLILSKLPIVKFTLAGEDHRIQIVADVDKRLLSKQEFEEALAAILTAYSYLSKIEGIGVVLAKKGLAVLLELVSKWHEKGKSRSEAIRALVRAGIDPGTAEKIVETVYPARKAGGSDLLIQ